MKSGITRKKLSIQTIKHFSHASENHGATTSGKQHLVLIAVPQGNVIPSCEGPWYGKREIDRIKVYKIINYVWGRWHREAHGLVHPY